MRKLTAICCLITFIALQYGKVVSYWHCRIVAPIDCDCQKKLVQHSEEEHGAILIAIAKEKTEEVYLIQEPLKQPVQQINDRQQPQRGYQAAMPAGYTPAIFQPPRTV